MEDVNGHRLFLPPNYVSLAQLEEQWLKEKEKKQSEEEGIGRKGRGNSSEQYETFEGTKPSSPSFREKYVAVVADQERKPDELKKKKKKKKRSGMNRVGRKPKNEEIEAVVADQEQDEQKPHESNKEEKKEVNKWSRKIIKPRDEENERPGNQSRRRNDLRWSVNDQTTLVSRSLEKLSLNAGGDRRRRNVSGRFGTGRGNLVWVRKGEIATTDTLRVPK